MLKLETTTEEEEEKFYTLAPSPLILIQLKITNMCSVISKCSDSTYNIYVK